MRVLLTMLLGGMLITSTNALAGEARVTDVRVEARSDGSYDFFVSVLHEDTGWDHYADGWEVVAPDGEVIGKRVLLHPHVNEQPFTRSLGGVRIPAGVDSVAIRVHDSVHGYASTDWQLSLPKR